MTQNSGTSSILTKGQTQSKDTNYFTAVSECLSKEPPGLFKLASSTEGLKKPEQPKVPEVPSAGNGVFNKSSAFQVGAAGGRSPTLTAGGLSVAPGAQSAIKKNSNSETSAGGLGLQSGFNFTDSHQNLFLQASKESANPFLAYGDKIAHTSFVGFTGNEPQTLGFAMDSKPNLFTMAELPKGILSSTFPSISAAGSVSSFSTSTHPQSEVSVTKKEREVGEMPTSTSGLPILGSNGPDEVPGSFGQSQSQKFILEERGPSSKRDSDFSSNSDLSDLSENEEGLDKGQLLGARFYTTKDGVIQQKTKIQGPPKGRPRNKPFKGKS